MSFVFVDRLDAGQIAMEWVAFSSSRGNCKLNFETLDLLDRERLTKKAKKVDLYVRLYSSVGYLASSEAETFIVNNRSTKNQYKTTNLNRSSN